MRIISVAEVRLYLASSSCTTARKTNVPVKYRPQLSSEGTVTLPPCRSWVQYGINTMVHPHSNGLLSQLKSWYCPNEPIDLTHNTHRHTQTQTQTHRHRHRHRHTHTYTQRHTHRHIDTQRKTIEPRT